MAALASVVFWIASLSLAAGVWQNVARGKPARMSTTRQASQSAGNAVDGVTVTRYSGRDLVHTRVNEPTAWWKVDLQTPVQSPLVNVYFRTDFKYRRNGVQLYTSGMNSSDPKEGDLCHTVRGRANGADIPDILNATCPGTWRYLTVYTETDNNGQGAVLDFGQVQVWTCDSGHYGLNCEQSCTARHCKNDSRCDVIQGQCVGGCAAGYRGADCRQACDSGHYGLNCEQSCTARHCKNDSRCDVIQGQCVGGCAAGYRGVDCRQACDSGHYGLNCEQSCTARHCKNDSKCDVIQGQCVGGCAAGYRGVDCRQVCVSGYYGVNCDQSCAARHCKMDSSCDVTLGQCVGGCAAGYRGTACRKELEGYLLSTAGLIGLAAGAPFMLILGVILCAVLIRLQRLQRVKSTRDDGEIVQENINRNPAQPSDNNVNTSMSGHANCANDYESVEFIAEASNDYDVIPNRIYENM